MDFKAEFSKVEAEVKSFFEKGKAALAADLTAAIAKYKSELEELLASPAVSAEVKAALEQALSDIEKLVANVIAEHL